MFCKNCGAAMADQATFCPNCGTKTQTAPQTVQQPVQKPIQQPAQPQPAANLQSVLDVSGDVAKLLNYITLICFALAGFLWIYAGVSVDSYTELVNDWFFDLHLAFLPVIIGQLFFGGAIATMLTTKKAKCITAKTASLVSAVSGTVATVFAGCTLYSFIETKSSYELGDMNFAAWMVMILGIVGSVCAIANYTKTKKN